METAGSSVRGDANNWKGDNIIGGRNEVLCCLMPTKPVVVMMVKHGDSNSQP